MSRKISKNLKQAKERFIQGCKDEKPKEIAIASVEILLHDKKRFDVLAYELWFGHSVLEKIEVEKINVSQLSSQKFRNFVAQEWEEFKKEQEEKIDLSEEQEKEVINGVTDVIEKIEKS